VVYWEEGAALVGVFEPPPYELSYKLFTVVEVGRAGELPGVEIEGTMESGTMESGTMETPLAICAAATPTRESAKINDFMIKTRVTRKRWKGRKNANSLE
jgi:hypothetical protein